MVGNSGFDQRGIKRLERDFGDTAIESCSSQLYILPDMDKSHATNQMDSAFMKTISALAFVGLTLAGITYAQDTNVYYLPFDPKAYFGVQAKASARQEQLEFAKRLPECRPAELDPDGHWGAVICGFQMGLRFSTNTFVLGEPIEATVIIRNTTTNSLTLFAPQAESLQILVTNGSKDVLPESPKKLMISGPASLRFPERRQLRYSLAMDKKVIFPAPGTYHIKVKRLVQADTGNGNVELSSTAARLVLLPRNGTSRP